MGNKNQILCTPQPQDIVVGESPQHNILWSILLSSILSGMCIGLGGTIYSACDNKMIGALLFTIGLITICKFGLHLYTGKIGYIEFNKTSLLHIVVIIIGNFIGTFILGQMLYFTGKYNEAIQIICQAKLNMPLINAFILGIPCGILMFIAVNIYKKYNNIIGIIIGIPTFILAGFEHSIADMYYFALGNVLTFQSFSFIMVVILGNAVGAIVFKRILDKV